MIPGTPTSASTLEEMPTGTLSFPEKMRSRPRERGRHRPDCACKMSACRWSARRGCGEEAFSPPAALEAPSGSLRVGCQGSQFRFEAEAAWTVIGDPGVTLAADGRGRRVPLLRLSERHERQSDCPAQRSVSRPTGSLSGALTSRVRLVRDSRDWRGSSAHPTCEGERRVCKREWGQHSRKWRRTGKAYFAIRRPPRLRTGTGL